MSARTVGWSISLPLALGLMIIGLVGLAFVRYGDLSARPWGFIAFVLAVLGALTSLVLALVHAREVAD